MNGTQDWDQVFFGNSEEGHRFPFFFPLFHQKDAKMKMKVEKVTELSVTCPSYTMNTGRLHGKTAVKDQRMAGSHRRKETSIWRKMGGPGDAGGRQQGVLQWVLEVVGAIESLRAQK